MAIAEFVLLVTPQLCLHSPECRHLASYYARLYVYIVYCESMCDTVPTDEDKPFAGTGFPEQTREQT